MRKLWQMLFPPKIEIGDVFELDTADDNNPFKKKKNFKVVVKDVRNGYILYRYQFEVGRGSLQNESLSARMFASCYKRVPKDTQP